MEPSVFCMQCGKRRPDDAAFCPGCGTAFGLIPPAPPVQRTAPAPVSTEASAAAAAPAWPAIPDAGSAAVPVRRGPSRTVVVATLVILGVVSLPVIRNFGSIAYGLRSTSPTTTEAAVRSQGPSSANLGLGIGDTAHLADGVAITLVDAAYAAKLDWQKPPAGEVFVAFKVKVFNTSSSSLYVSSGDFLVAADGTQQGQSDFVVNDRWEPSLMLEDLAPGNSIEGWITFTVPTPASKVVLSYSGSPFSSAVDASWSVGCCR